MLLTQNSNYYIISGYHGNESQWLLEPTFSFWRFLIENSLDDPHFFRVITFGICKGNRIIILKKFYKTFRFFLTFPYHKMKISGQ